MSGGAAALGAAGVQVLHVVGPARRAPPPSRGRDVRTSSSPYVDRMDYALAAADLMICRAGANSVTEAAAVGVPAIFVPLPIGNGEQAATPSRSSTPGERCWSPTPTSPPTGSSATVPPLVADPERLAAMSAAASGLIPRDADEKLARIVLEVAETAR